MTAPQLSRRRSTGCRPSSTISPPAAASRSPTRSNGPARRATSRRTPTTTPPRTSRATWRAGSVSSSTCSRTPRSSTAVVRIYTVVYDGDSDDMAERYLIGNMEEQVDGADVISAVVAARRGARRRIDRRHDHLRRRRTGPDRQGARRRAGLTHGGASPHRTTAPAPLRPGRSSLRRCRPGGSSSSTSGARCSSATSAARPGRRPSCCCTAGRPPPTSTGSAATRRSASTTASIAFDHRGHGTGIRSKKTFRLEDCADDVVDVARRARHRPVHRRRLLDGRADRPAPLAPPSRARRRASCCARRRPGSPARREERLGVHGPLRARRGGPHHARPGDAVADRAVLPAAQGEEVGAVGDPGGRRATTGGWCSRRAGRSAASRRRVDRRRSTCRRRSSSRCATASCRSTARRRCSS